MSMIGRVVERYKNQKKREDMCLPELKKQIKRRKNFFLLMYCMTIFIGYLGFILTFDVSQILAGFFISLIFVLFTIIAYADYMYTRLIHYLKFNEE